MPNVSTTPRGDARVDEAAIVSALPDAHEILDAGPATAAATAEGRRRGKYSSTMPTRWPSSSRPRGRRADGRGPGGRAVRSRPVQRALEALQAGLSLHAEKARAMRTACRSVTALLDATTGETLQQRWTTVEQQTLDGLGGR